MVAPHSRILPAHGPAPPCTALASPHSARSTSPFAVYYIGLLPCHLSKCYNVAHDLADTVTLRPPHAASGRPARYWRKEK